MDGHRVPFPTHVSEPWKMDDEPRAWVLAGHDAVNRAALLWQIDDAESDQLPRYYLIFHNRSRGLSVRSYSFPFNPPGPGGSLERSLPPPPPK